jgi:8-oxo-dGTP diphosphatase
MRGGPVAAVDGKGDYRCWALRSLVDRETLVVTGAVIPVDGKVLVARRLPTSRFEPGKWEFPGGKVDFGEHPESTIVREIGEETGMTVGVERLYHVSTHVYSDNRGQRHVILLFYLCRIVSGEPSARDCAEVRYVSRDGMGALAFVEGDASVVRSVLADDAIWVS